MTSDEEFERIRAKVAAYPAFDPDAAIEAAVAAERERCAKIVESYDAAWGLAKPVAALIRKVRRMMNESDEALAARMRKAMAEYKEAAMYYKEQGDEDGFKRYRQSWCVLEAFLPVDPKEYW